MEAVYFAFGLLVLALVLGIILKRSAPQVTPEAIATDRLEDLSAAVSESAAGPQLAEPPVGSLLLSSDEDSHAHDHIREMVARLQLLSGTTAQNTQTPTSGGLTLSKQ
jgi:hypothetical protein